MKKKKEKKSTKSYLIVYAYAVLVLFLLTTVCSYAWLSLTRTPRVSNLSIYINSSPGMEISMDPDAKEWGQQITYEELFDDEYELRPVTWSQKEQRFFAANYSPSGKRIEKWTPLDDEKNSNKTTYENYYCKGTFYARSGQDVKVSLADTAAANEERTAMTGTYLIGAPVWNSEKILHDNGGKGAETAIRFGIKITRLDGELKPLELPAEFYIYEPNSDAHTDESKGYLQTPSIDGEESLVPKDRLITQSETAWQEHSPVQKDLLVYSTGSFDGSSELFELKAEETVKIDLYIWLEGQDADCTNAIAKAKISANFQLNAQTGGNPGLVPIPPKDEQ